LQEEVTTFNRNCSILCGCWPGSSVITARFSFENEFISGEPSLAFFVAVFVPDFEPEKFIYRGGVAASSEHILRLFGRNTNLLAAKHARHFCGYIRLRFQTGEFHMELDQAQTYHPEKRTKTRVSAKNERQALPLKKSRLSSELETLRAVSKRTFSSGNRMAVHRFLGAIFNQVSVWEAEDRLEEGLYRLLDSLKAAVPLKIGEAFAVAIYCTAPHLDKKNRSKWARALRFAALTKPSNEPFRAFIKRKGGINACASRYAEYVRRPGKI
jgi:hypothetical protein